MKGLGGVQSAVEIAGAHAERIDRLFDIFLVVTSLMFLLVLGFLIAAMLRRRGQRQDGLPDPEGVSHDAGLRVTLAGWIGLISIGLVGLTLASFLSDRSLAQVSPEAQGDSRDPLAITVTAQQWWWQVDYDDPIPSQRVSTANELVLPVGRPVDIRLESTDVIHSFWVPSLAGKQDLIPGRHNDIRLLPTKIGRYRGQCAEFCGMQHAHMAFDVTVVSPAEFERWRTRQLATPAPPTTPLAQAGYDYFMNNQCSACHQIAGTPANGRVGPNLTHVASRRSLAAGAMPNNLGHLYGWVADPQSQKPGVNMPYIGLEPAQLHAVVAYLETLK